MSKHTKGPWEWCSFDGKTIFLGTPDRGRLVVMDFKRSGMQVAVPRFAIRADNMGGIMQEATPKNIYTFPDARLISAAPDLLAACKKVLERWTFDNDQRHTHTWHDMQDCCAVIRAAIAKAEGTP